jgi:hypothetical protein
MIIGLSGLIGSGKNTVAEYLKKQGFVELSFAAALKDMVAATFGWQRELLEGTTQESREFRETVDAWWSERLAIPNFTPRYALQYVGTDVFRKHFNDAIWVLNVERKIFNLTAQGTNITITDVRFPNEVASLRKLGGKFLLISPVNKPEWYELAKRYVRGIDYDRFWMIQNKTSMKDRYPHVHESEYAWINEHFDAEIINSGTIDDLHQQVQKQLEIWD